jgi:hypothetical protein
MLKRKPYILFFAVALLLSIYIFVLKIENISILNIKDTYYVVSNVDFYITIIAIFLFLGLLYFVFERINVVLFSIISKVHVFGTLILPSIFMYFKYKESLPLSQTINFDQQICYGNDYNFYKFISILLFFLLQFLFIINIIVSLIKKAKSFRASRRN